MNAETHIEVAPPPPLRRATRFAYGFGSIADGIKNAAFSTYLLLYFNQVLGVKASVVSTAIALTLAVDAIADPMIGRVSDLTRSRLGRRHPFIYGAAIPTALFFGLTWFPPAGLSDFAMGVWIFTFAALARLFMSTYQVPANALGSELSQDYEERTRLYGLRYWFGYAGTFAFAAFALAVFFRATPEYPRGQLNPAGYTPFALTAAALILISILVCGWGTRSRIPYIRQAEDREGPGGFSRMLGKWASRSEIAHFSPCSYLRSSSGPRSGSTARLRCISVLTSISLPRLSSPCSRSTGCSR